MAGKSKYRWLLWGLGILAGLYLLLCISMYLFQGALLFHPVSLPQEYNFHFKDKPTELFLSTPDGERINALHFQANDSTRSKVILYLHGNGGCLDRCARTYPEFMYRGYDFFAIDYRGYGKSTGSPGEQGMFVDAQAAYQHLLEKYPKEDIIIYGQSMGSGVASWLAAQTDPDLLILHTPFFSVLDLASERMSFLPVAWLLDHHFRSDQYLASRSKTTHLIHGTEDGVVPYEHSIRLKKLLGGNCTLHTIPKGEHNNLNTFPQFGQILDQVLGPVIN